jgi:hypothetical protein
MRNMFMNENKNDRTERTDFCGTFIFVFHSVRRNCMIQQRFHDSINHQMKRASFLTNTACKEGRQIMSNKGASRF